MALIYLYAAYCVKNAHGQADTLIHAWGVAHEDPLLLISVEYEPGGWLTARMASCISYLLCSTLHIPCEVVVMQTGGLCADCT